MANLRLLLGKLQPWKSWPIWLDTDLAANSPFIRSNRKDDVHRVWKEAGLKPHRIERYLASDDPDFESKAADIIGLYLNPPQHAAVFCVDERRQFWCSASWSNSGRSVGIFQSDPPSAVTLPLRHATSAPIQ